ncbi:methylamine utilization protein MauJ [Paraburkholderia terrae]
MADQTIKTSEPKATMPRPYVNERVSLTIVPVFENRPPASSSGSHGEYEATFVLGVPGTTLFHKSLDIPHLLSTGDSLLVMPPDAVQIQCEIGGEAGKAAQIRFLPNAEGRLARAEMKFHAPSFAEAEQVAWNLISDMLSMWSFRHDSAVDISGYQIREVTSHVIRTSFGIVGAPKIIDINLGGPSTQERRSLLAAYREATNSTNPFYQFLSFFKVVEGVHKTRVQRRKANSKKGAVREEIIERFPTSAADFPENLSDVAQSLAGKRYNAVVDEMRATVRNALAHLNPLDTYLTADRYGDIRQCEMRIPTLRFIARQMLASELQQPVEQRAPSTFVRET